MSTFNYKKKMLRADKSLFKILNKINFQCYDHPASKYIEYAYRQYTVPLYEIALVEIFFYEYTYM